MPLGANLGEEFQVTGLVGVYGVTSSGRQVQHVQHLHSVLAVQRAPA